MLDEPNRTQNFPFTHRILNLNTLMFLHMFWTVKANSKHNTNLVFGEIMGNKFFKKTNFSKPCIFLMDLRT